MYYDGANFNAILGWTNPGLMGFDAVHYNPHKTFSQPHGGGGPVVQLVSKPIWHLPSPIVAKREIESEDEHLYAVDECWYTWQTPESTIGKSNNGMVMLSGCQMLGILQKIWKRSKTMSEHAVLNANYLRHAILTKAEEAGVTHMFAEGAPINACKHEFTISMSR